MAEHDCADDKVVWRKSLASATGDCVEVATLGSTVLVRNSREPAASQLVFSESEWRAFIVGAHRGEFDLLPGHPLALSPRRDG